MGKPQGSSVLALCLESSGDGGGAAVVRLHAGRAPEVVSEERLPTPRSHGGQLVPAVDRAVAAAGGRSAVSLVLVNTGPGSYTGLRVGQAAAETLALVGGMRAIGVPCMEVMCEEWVRRRANAGNSDAASSAVLIPALDARQDECLAAAFEWRGGVLRRLSADRVVAAERLGELAEGVAAAHVFGQAAAVYAGRFSAGMQVDTAEFQVAPASVGFAAWRLHGEALLTMAATHAPQNERIDIAYFRPILAKTIAERTMQSVQTAQTLQGAAP